MVMWELILAIVFLGIYFFFKKINNEVKMDEARRQYEEMLRQHSEWEMQQMNETAVLAVVADDESRRREVERVVERQEDVNFDIERELFIEDLLFGDSYDEWGDEYHNEWSDDLYGNQSDDY